MVTAEELVKFHEQNCNKARSLVTPKGNDYSSNAEQDTLANLRIPTTLGHAKNNIQTMQIVLDLKWGRIDSLTKNLNKPINFETVDETVHDFINYLIYLLWFYHELKTRRNSTPNIQAIESGRIQFGESGIEEDI
jgi:predicted nucleotide-binding protein (sugar kinase/HSP70/actin superfamily)